MKIILRTAAVAALILTASCGKDTADAIADIFEETEQLEKTPLDVGTIADNVIINGGAKTEGVPPTPNGAISLDVSETSKTAFLNEGFDISLSSDADIVGAYLRFKDEEGSVAGSYYDINIVDNSAGKSVKKGLVKRTKINFLSSKIDDVTLDVDFGPAIEPGTFCYEICVYDAQGNISLPQEVCATVQSWGGKAELVGSWNLTKQEVTEQGETEVELVGEEDCYTNTVFCGSLDETVEYEECYTMELGNITFSADGEFTTEFNGSGTDIDYEASGEQCQAIFNEDEEDSDIYKGFWAYNDETSTLTLVAYENTYTYGGETEEWTYDAGEGDLLFDGVIELNGNSFIISDYEEEEYGYIYRSYFTKN